MITLSHTYTARFVFYHDNAPTTPDNVPTAVLLRNGAASGETAVVTAVSGQTGEYTITFTTLAGWAATDHLEVRITVDHASTIHRSIVFDSLALPDAPMRGTENASTHTAADAATAVVGRSEFTALQTAVETTLPGLINGINQSASRRITLATSTAYEVPDSGASTFTVELRTFDGDGALVAATVSPTLAVNGSSSGDLSARLSAVANPSTGIYRWTFTVNAGDTVEQIWFDGSAVLTDGTFTHRAFSAITDAVAVDFTEVDRTNLSNALAEIQKVPRGAGAIAAGAAVSKTNNSATPAQTISETINGAA